MSEKDLRIYKNRDKMAGGLRNASGREMYCRIISFMVDAFMDAGYNYFDTSYMYHNGESEIAVRKAVVERYPRDRFFIATKFPLYVMKEESQVEQIFSE